MSDPRMKEMGADMPFDGKRMIMGGFDAIVEEGSERGGYTDGFVVPVPEGKREPIASSPRRWPRCSASMARPASSRRCPTTCRRAKSPTSTAR